VAALEALVDPVAVALLVVLAVPQHQDKVVRAEQALLH
jgi:hypothetical protein